MCTVTVIPVQGGIRLACNRDEQRTRPVSLPPQNRRYRQRQAILPIDPISDGTWIAVHDAGLAMTLLNVNPGLGKPGLRSRGEIIPQLLHVDSLESALGELKTLRLTSFDRFRLVVVDQHELAEFRWDGQSLPMVQCTKLTKPLFFTSSGLGDPLVEAPRRELFEKSFTTPDQWVSQQDAFHQHEWPDRQQLSIRMQREDARTVSHTLVQLRPESVELVYRQVDAQGFAPPIVTSLRRTAGGGA